MASGGGTSHWLIGPRMNVDMDLLVGMVDRTGRMISLLRRHTSKCSLKISDQVGDSLVTPVQVHGETTANDRRDNGQ